MKTEIERLQAELAELREREGKYKQLIETTDTGFVILDEAGRVLDANLAYVKLTGHERLEQIRGRAVTEWTAPHDLERNRQAVLRCLKDGIVRNLEIEYIGADGQFVPIEINATVQLLPAGNTILTVCRAISERRKSAEALRNSEQRYRATINAMTELIHVVDPQLRITLVNRAGVEWLGQVGAAHEIVGREVFEVFPFLPAHVRQEYQSVLAGLGPLVTVECTTLDGREVLTETRKIPIEDGDRVVGVVTVIRDITNQARDEERRRQSEKMEALGQLAGGIAHDFNNQLTAILGFAELLGRRLSDPRELEHAQTIARIASRSSDLTRQLLSFARKERVHSVQVDVHDLLREVVGILERTLSSSIEIHMHLDSPQSELVGDPGQLQSAILNLALNARDAMPEGGALTFATDLVPIDEANQACERRPGPYLRVRVTDSGEGMTEEVRRRLFEPFFTTKGPGKGTGIGLATVYAAVRNHLGTISVKSEPGRGSTFTMLLPVTARHGLDPEVPAVHQLKAGQGHLLIADDESAVLRMTSVALVGMGYRITTCSDGAEAVARFRELWQEVDLVLLDVQMPNVDGPSAFEKMRRIDPTVRALFVSGQPISAEVQRWIEQGGVGFLPKPYTLRSLGNALALALRSVF